MVASQHEHTQKELPNFGAVTSDDGQTKYATDRVLCPTPRMSVKRAARAKIEFWLNGNSGFDVDLYHWLQSLKRKKGESRRGMLPVIRDALRLYRDLYNGNIDVLCEMFPAVGRKLAAIAGNDRVDEMIANQRLILDKMQDVSGVESADGIDFDLKTVESVFVAADVDPTEARKNFTAGLGDLFGEDDDLWDD